MKTKQTETFKGNLIFYQKLMIPVSLIVTVMIIISMNAPSIFNSDIIIEPKWLPSGYSDLSIMIVVILLLFGLIQLCSVACAFTLTVLNKYGFKTYFVTKTYLKAIYLIPTFYRKLFSDQDFQSDTDDNQDTDKKIENVFYNIDSRLKNLENEDCPQCTQNEKIRKIQDRKISYLANKLGIKESELDELENKDSNSNEKSWQMYKM